MFNLRRLSSGLFKIEDSISLDEIDESKIIPISKVFSYLPRVEFKPYLLKMIQNGVPLDERNVKIETPFVAVIDNKEVAIYNTTDKLYKYKIEVLL